MVVRRERLEYWGNGERMVGREKEMEERTS